MPRLAIPLLLLVCGVTLPRPVAAQSGAPAEPDPLRAQIDAIAGRAPALRLLREPWMGALAEGGGSDLWIDLQGGRPYQLIWVCDEDCTDLDLQIFDSGDALLGYATDTDDLSILSLTPRSSGRYRLRVTMLGCRAAPCRYGIAMFGRPPR